MLQVLWYLSLLAGGQ